LATPQNTAFNYRDNQLKSYAIGVKYAMMYPIKCANKTN